MKFFIFQKKNSINVISNFYFKDFHETRNLQHKNELLKSRNSVVKHYETCDRTV